MISSLMVSHTKIFLFSFCDFDGTRKSALKPKEVKEPGRLKQGSTTALPRAPPVGKKKANLNYIILVKEDTLIFKFTTIKIEKTPGYWICKEKGCQTILEGNDSTLFQEMRAHVNEKHATSVAYKSNQKIFRIRYNEPIFCFKLP